MEKELPIIFSATGGNFGLGCNSIHLLDLFWRLTGLSKGINLNGNHLARHLLPNRRGADLVEFSGTILASTERGDLASVSFNAQNLAPVVLNIDSPSYRVFVDEGNAKAAIASKDNKWQWKDYDFRPLYSSDLTTKIAESIFETDDCYLPTLQESFVLHKELFRIFNEHVERVSGKIPVLCPIT